MKASITTAATVTALVSLTTPSQAQSFNCRYAKLPAEVAICQNAELRNRDNWLATLYSENRGKPGSQQRWLQRRNRCGHNVDCLLSAYSVRIRQLEAGGLDITT